MNSLLAFSLLLAVVCVASGYTRTLQLVPLTDDQQVDESRLIPRIVQAEAADLEGAATGHGHYGRVQIKVYRGPTTHGHHDHFAPHGFWVKQPADDHH